MIFHGWVGTWGLGGRLGWVVFDRDEMEQGLIRVSAEIYCVRI
jgi:hypothetical protein